MYGGLGFAETFAPPEVDYDSMSPYDALLAYNAAHPGDFAQPGYQTVGAPQSGGVMALLQKNATAVYFGAAALAAMAIFGGRRR